MISEAAGVEIMNPDHVLCHVDKGGSLSMELTVASGKGYVPANQNRSEDAPIDLFQLILSLALSVRLLTKLKMNVLARSLIMTACFSQLRPMGQ